MDKMIEIVWFHLYEVPRQEVEQCLSGVGVENGELIFKV